MSERLNKRVRFPKGTQRIFMASIIEKLNINRRDLGIDIGVSERTVTEWLNEGTTIPLWVVKILTAKAQIPLPDGYTILDRYWYTEHAGKIGGKALVNKYGVVGGDPSVRKHKWRIWWQQSGKTLHTHIGLEKPVRLPKLSTSLAEFVGILLGDGGISNYQVTITLHIINDRLYRRYVCQLITDLFSVIPSMVPHKGTQAITIVVSRKKLVNFLTQTLGLVVGNKIRQQIDFPNWITKSHAYSIACLRGLIDTDGSVIIHTYQVNGRTYRYKKLDFTSHSKPLILSVSRVLQSIGLKPRLTKNGWSLRLESRVDINKYFKIVGTHNPKHLKRFHSKR